MRNDIDSEPKTETPPARENQDNNFNPDDNYQNKGETQPQGGGTPGNSGAELEPEEKINRGDDLVSEDEETDKNPRD